MTKRMDGQVLGKQTCTTNMLGVRIPGKNILEFFVPNARCSCSESFGFRRQYYNILECMHTVYKRIHYNYIYTHIYIYVHTHYSTVMSTSRINHTLQDGTLNSLIPTKCTIKMKILCSICVMFSRKVTFL